jgi:hypothetical protein
MPLLLCCFERDCQDCHRAIAAQWIERHLGWPVAGWEATKPDPQLRRDQEATR